MRTKKVKIKIFANKVDKTFRKLMHKLHDQRVKLMIFKNVKQCGVQQFAYLATEICNKYMQQIKWKVKYLPYKGYNYVNQDSVKDVFLNLSLMTSILGQLPFTKGN